MPTQHEPRISLYAVSHKGVWLPDAECIFPMRADRTDGINIADKEAYCELRAQYWVWRNEDFADNDYVGFFHYRRYLDFSDTDGRIAPSGKRPLPYRIQKKPVVQRYQRETVLPAIAGFDVIAPVWEYTGLTVWERYEKWGHRIKDLKQVYQILTEKYPEFISAADTYLQGKGEYYGNIYIMRWHVFCEYCKWLFDILHEYDIIAETPSARIDGYLGERLFGIYFTWLQAQKNVACSEYPRVHFSCYDDNSHGFNGRALLNFFLPPGTQRRRCVLCVVSNLSSWKSG